MSVATINRKVRQESLRDLLSSQGHLQHVLDIADKFRDTEKMSLMETQAVQGLKHAADIHLKLINKYLPDLKATEITGDGGEALAVDLKWVVEVAD